MSAPQPSQEPSPRHILHLQSEATRGWAKLCEHEEGRTLGDEGASVAAVIAERGWTVLAAGAVSIARGKGCLWAVGLRGTRPWGVPVRTDKEGDRHVGWAGPLVPARHRPGKPLLIP